MSIILQFSDVKHTYFLLLCKILTNDSKQMMNRKARRTHSKIIPNMPPKIMEGLKLCSSTNIPTSQNCFIEIHKQIMDRVKTTISSIFFIVSPQVSFLTIGVLFRVIMDCKAASRHSHNCLQFATVQYSMCLYLLQNRSDNRIAI